MLYTVTPLERIYSNQVESLIISRYKEDDIKNNSINDRKCVDIKHGKLYAKKSGDSYIVDGIYSTDMSDYLNSEYSPGSILNQN